MKEMRKGRTNAKETDNQYPTGMVKQESRELVTLWYDWNWKWFGEFIKNKRKKVKITHIRNEKGDNFADMEYLKWMMSLL